MALGVFSFNNLCSKLILNVSWYDINVSLRNLSNLTSLLINSNIYTKKIFVFGEGSAEWSNISKVVWSYACHGTWLWPCFRDCHMHFWVIVLATPSVPMLCLKDLPMGDDTIYPELLTIRVVHWNKLPGCWQLKDKKNSPLTIIYWNNGITILYTTFLKREIVAFVVFERQTIEVFSWCSFSSLFNFSES